MNLPHDFFDVEPLLRAIAAIEGGRSFRAAYEQLLLESSEDDADRWMQIQREARGTWMHLLRVPTSPPRRERALFVGNALSGAHTPLAEFGFDVTLFDTSAERLRFAQLRNAALVSAAAGPHSTHIVHARGERRLPFEDRAFELVVQEDGVPAAERGWHHDLDELRRVCSAQLLVIADNRWAYKRSTGRRGVFEVPTPWRYARGLVQRSPERTLSGYRALLSSREFSPPEAFALYPHAREFTFVVGLDHNLPRLEVGPRERRNRWKVIARSIGLFPWLVPSFALISTRKSTPSADRRIDRVLARLAELTGEPQPQVEHLVATRGNSSVVLTRAQGEDERGGWCVHIGMSAAQRSQLHRHFATLSDVTRDHRACPVPAPLYEGELDGLYVTCERRARGVTATQLTGRLDATRRTLADLATMLAALTLEAPSEIDEHTFEQHIARRVQLVMEKAPSESTRRTLTRMLSEARRGFLGERVPRVLQHSDLRSKHVQVESDGRVTAVLDWGSSQRGDLPYFDLLHYVAHERKQAEGWTPERMWRLVRERVDLRDFERAALDAYALRLGLSEKYCRAVEALYPALVAAMVETHWDYSRPRWLERQFGI